MPFNTSDDYLVVRGLCKSYGEDEARVEVLKHIDVSLAKGEVCVLLGPSGSGKSTFLNIVGGLESADAGSIDVGGNLALGDDARAVTVHVSLVLCLPIIVFVIDLLVQLMMTQYSGNLEIWIAPQTYVIEVLIGAATYAVVAMLHMRRIRKVPLALAMKVQE